MSFVPDTQNKEFQDALNLIQYTRQSVFLTGKAGTGKSTFLKYICANTKKKHVVLAPTGIAAINAGGSTLHSFFKLPFYPLLPDDPNFSLQRGRIHEFFKYTKPHRKLLEELELVIIDEISMVRADIIDAVDRILRVYSRNLREPFGGKQILLVGDVFQLEPVVKGDEREILNRFYPTPYFFSARVFGQIDLVSIELQKVYRQTDSKFIHVLDHIRNNTVGSAELQLLNTRYGTQIEESEADMYITLATRRDNVDHINDKKLAELPGEPVTFSGEITGDFPESSLPTSQELVLKPGAQIIFIKNDFDRRWVNGTIGIISGFDPFEETLYVITDDGKECDVKRESWRNIRYKYNEEKKQIEEEIIETGKRTTIDLGVHGLHPELIRLIGKMKYRSSYGQNLLQHARETANLCAIMAAELGLNVKKAKRAGLLHDIGKVPDDEPELPHAILGMQLAEKYKEKPDICNAIGAHHEEIEMTTLIAPIVQACDAISGARPGARREVVESYIKRLKDMEDLALSYNGVVKTYAIQAGRELRVVVGSEKISDAEAEKISFDIAKRIQDEMTYPGQVKVTVIRETRAINYAK